MLNNERAGLLVQLVGGARRNALRSARGRRAFAGELARTLNLWEPNVQTFVEEMAGLNFYSAEDRQLFIQFALCGL